MKLKSVLAILTGCLVSLCLAFGQGAPMRQATPSAADMAKLTKLEKEYKSSQAVLKSRPRDKKAIERFSTIGALYGHESMMSPALPPRVKYRQALHIYREVLKVDPLNKVAKADSDLIISIYKSMGRPIPKD